MGRNRVSALWNKAKQDRMGRDGRACDGSDRKAEKKTQSGIVVFIGFSCGGRSVPSATAFCERRSHGQS